MCGRAHVGVRSLLLGLTTAVVGVLLLPGCGGSGSMSASSTSQPALLGHDAIRAPKATELRRGMSVHVRRAKVRSVGWQVSCTANGRRVNAEAVRGQRTGSGEVAGFKGGTPSIWVKHNRDGSIDVSCR
jgi:hypothetical protein